MSNVEGPAASKIIDWEYSRVCMASYDPWLLLYDRYRRPYYKNPGETKFNPLKEGYNYSLKKLFGLSMPAECPLPSVPTCHILHLIERHSFLTKLNENFDVDCQSVLEIMENDINNAVQFIKM